MSVIYQNRGETLTAKITIDNHYPAHFHRQVEILYILDGSLEVTVGQEHCLLREDSLSVTFPDLIHQTCTHTSSAALLLIFDTRVLPDFQNDFSSLIPQSPFLHDVSASPVLRAALDDLVEYAKAGTQNPRLLKGYLSIFLNFLLEELTLLPCQPEKSDLCQKIAAYLNTHFTENISLSDLAHDLGYSKYHISHVCSEKFGCSFLDYLNLLRAEHAMELLRLSDTSITDACYASGFGSIRTFYRVFKERYGQTPGECRKS